MLDHNAQLVSATRTCLDCGQTFTREQMRNRLGWEPIGAGWRCGDCSRARHAELRARALALIEDTPEPWTLALASLEDCDDPDALATAQAMMLDGRLSGREAGKLRDVVLAEVSGRERRRAAR